MRRFVILLLALLTMLAVVGATLITFQDETTPTAYSTATSTSVNLSIKVNSTTPGVESVFNVSWLNKSSSDGTYGILGWVVAGNNITNSTLFTLKDKTRHWIWANVTNGSTTSSSTARIIDVDTAYYVLNVGDFGTVNISTVEGDINISGILNANSIRLNPSTTLVGACDAGNYGTMRYNTTASTFYGCTPDGWKRFVNMT